MGAPVNYLALTYKTAHATILSVKATIYVFVVLGSLIGGAIGTNIDNGNMFGIWSIFLSGIGGIFGIWAGYTINKNYF